MADNYPVDSSTKLRDVGTKGVMSAGAGLGLIVVNFLFGIPVLGQILSGGLVILGASSLFGKNKSSTDKVSGTIAIAAGAAGLASFLLPGLTKTLLGTGGLALFVFGLWNIFQFARGIRKQGK